jgi:PPOX class probable F420-dependent enzyme
MPRLTEKEAWGFLNERSHLARIGTVDPDGMPRVVPVWFLIARGELFFTPRMASALLANVRRDPRVCVSIDEEAIPYRKVTVQGFARIAREPGEDDAWRDLYRAICAR